MAMAAGKGRHAYNARKMASGVQDITCVFVEVAESSILQCPGMVCSPPVVSKCLGEAHRRLELFTLFKSFLYFHTVNDARMFAKIWCTKFHPSSFYSIVA